MIEFGLAGVSIRNQSNLPGVATDRLDEEIALAVDRTKAPLFDRQQPIVDTGGFPAIAEVGSENA